MSAFFNDIIGFLIGSHGFDGPIFVLISVALILICAAVAALGRPVLDPVAVIVALKPRRGALWMPLSIVVGALAIMAPVVTIVASPLAIFVMFGEIGVGLLGYAAVATILGDRLTRAAGHDVPAPAAAVLGVVILRLIRAVPFVGGPVHALAVWFGFACAMALTWDKALSWHRRRLPDERQFPDAPVIEWNAAEDATPQS